MLTVYSLGFFLYPYHPTGDGGTTAPFLAALQAPDHSAAVIVSKSGNLDDGDWQGAPIDRRSDVRLRCEDSNGQLPIANANVKRARFINGMPPDPIAEESWQNFDLLPDARTMVDRAVLRSDWQDQLLFRLDFLGGEITAVPDAFTMTRIWRWQNGHRQAISSLACYQVKIQSGWLSVDDHAFELDANSVVLFLNIASGRENDLGRYARGIDHHAAMIKLCEPESRIEIQNPLDSDPCEIGSKLRANAYNDVVSRAKASALRTSATIPGMFEGGYPSCGGRRIGI